MDDTPDRELSAKLAQHMAMAVQIAEAIIRLRQQRADTETTAATQQGGAARAERTAQHAADRVSWSRVTDRDWLAGASLTDLGRAWGAAAGWADTDPAADLAARRVETRLGQLAPNAMARYDELRETGTTRLDAMRDVLDDLAAETRVRVGDWEPTVYAPEPPRSPTPGTDLDLVGGDAGSRARAAAGVARDEWSAAATWQAEADAARGSARDAGGHRITPSGNPHPVDVAADSHPHPYTTVSPGPGRAAGPASTAAGAAHRAPSRAMTR